MRPCRCDSIKGAHLPPRGKPPPVAEMNRSSSNSIKEEQLLVRSFGLRRPEGI
ncbi:hypothetical protein KR50_31580 [Jeotgalibacillus campisalis]|uniref:Uncharacterized protein n=1 Tax=Jeotgalibacillus campisalis TaxID=220754 RepID=A0A0C2VI04_9BACL|nr:hypothetical protein KR50_31580 [Jeotgalibacillus campisalis]